MKYTASISWSRKSTETFTDNKYSRVHHWQFDGGADIDVSASPQVVPLPLSDEMLADPEELFLGSLSSCHMLFFLSYAASAGYCVQSYTDRPEALMGKDAGGKIAMLKIELKPLILFDGDNMPDADAVKHLHHRAHESCFLANSIKASIIITPQSTI